jgi:hypothetical protein
VAKKTPERKAEQAAAEQPSRTLRILARLRGEDPKALLEGLDAAQDPELLPFTPDPEDVDPDLPDPALSPSEQRRVLAGRARAGAYRGTSPTTRR